jgi:hypothetical protein
MLESIALNDVMFYIYVQLTLILFSFIVILCMFRKKHDYTLIPSEDLDLNSSSYYEYEPNNTNQNNTNQTDDNQNDDNQNDEDIINEKCTNKTFNDCEEYIPNENRIKEYF